MKSKMHKVIEELFPTLLASPEETPLSVATKYCEETSYEHLKEIFHTLDSSTQEYYEDRFSLDGLPKEEVYIPIVMRLWIENSLYVAAYYAQGKDNTMKSDIYRNTITLICLMFIPPLTFQSVTFIFENLFNINISVSILLSTVIMLVIYLPFFVLAIETVFSRPEPKKER